MAIGILTSLSFIYYLTGSSLLYLSLHQNAWDLGIFNQVLYNTVTYFPFAYSFRSFGNYLGDHFSPVLLLFAPLSLTKSSLPILAVQAGGVALAVLALYLLAKRFLKSHALAFAIAFSFAVNPFTLNILNFDFHPDFLFPLLFFSTIYFLFKVNRWGRLSPIRPSQLCHSREGGNPGKRNLDAESRPGMTEGESGTKGKRKFLLYAFTCVILLQLVREDAALLIGPLAILAYFKFGQKEFAQLALGFTLAYSLAVNLAVMPTIRQGASSPLAEHYPYLGRSVGEIALNIAGNPLLVVQKLAGADERTTIFKFLGSTGFLALLSPLTLVLSFPIFAAHFLSVVPMRINLEGHYPAQLLSFAYVAMVFGLASLIRGFSSLRHAEGGPNRIRSISDLSLFNIIVLKLGDSSHAFALRMTERKLEKFISAYLVLVSVISFALFSPFPPSLSADLDRFTVTQHHKLFFELIKMIPDGAAVSAQTNLVPALAFRKGIYEFPDLRNADYVFLDEKGPVSGQSINWGYYEKKKDLEKLGYKLVKDEDGLKIYTRH